MESIQNITCPAETLILCGPDQYEVSTYKLQLRVSEGLNMIIVTAGGS
jgi:hypothetical protein